MKKMVDCTEISKMQKAEIVMLFLVAEKAFDRVELKFL